MAAALLCALLLVSAVTATSAAEAPQAVLQHHKVGTRQGFYLWSHLAKANVAKTTKSKVIKTLLTGSAYGQLLYYERADIDLIIAVTEANHITATNAATGKVAYDRLLAPPMTSANLPCGNIYPTLGVTSTPIISAQRNSLFVAGMSSPDGGKTARHLIWRLNPSNGRTRHGWPLDVAAILRRKYRVQFNANVQSQRGALAILKDRLYVPYGGLAGDCGDYHGWVVSVALTNPNDVTYYRTSGRKGGIWTPGGVTTDGDYAYVSTGNTVNAGYWQEGNAVLRLQPGARFRNVSTDFFTPAQWKLYDSRDIDLCGTHPVILDFPKNNPLVAQFGKDGVGYLMNRNNLRGHKGPIFSRQLADSVIISAPAVYRAADDNIYIVFKGTALRCPGGATGDVMAVRMKHGRPPSFTVAWCALQGGSGAPMATAANSGGTKAVVWSAGSDSSDDQLFAFDGVTGKRLWASPSGVLGKVSRFHTPMFAKGRVYIASSTGVHGFDVGGL